MKKKNIDQIIQRHFDELSSIKTPICTNLEDKIISHVKAQNNSKFLFQLRQIIQPKIIMVTLSLGVTIGISAANLMLGTTSINTNNIITISENEQKIQNSFKYLTSV